MLSNVSIRKYLTTGDLVIDPWEENMMGAAKITLHLGKKLLIPQPGIVVDIKQNRIPEYKEFQLENSNPFQLEPNMFILGETYEKIGLSERMGMILEGRSTLARLGISVVQTAMVVDTGQKPKIMTLEIKNSGPNTVLLYPQMKFCKGVFFLVDPKATIRYDTDGKYREDDPQKPIFENEFKEE